MCQLYRRGASSKLGHVSVKKHLKSFWEEWRSLLIFLLVMILFRSAIADWNQVPTGSMLPTILEGDRVVVNKLAYDLKVPFTGWQVAEWGDPQRGEIVTFYSPQDETLLIKRVMGVPGDIVRMRNNQIYVNDEPAEYSALDESIVRELNVLQRRERHFFFEKVEDRTYPVMLRAATPNEMNSFGPIEIPEGKYLMLGDNRDNSRDSREIGLIDRERIMGRAHTVAFSVDYDQYYLPRPNRFIHPLD